MYCSILETPLGVLIIKSTDQHLSFIGFDIDDYEVNPSAGTELVKLQMQEYFNGERLTFDFSLQQSGSQFQQSVWAELTKIDAGKPISYAALSKKMNSPLAIRAIAAANGKNKLMIAVPCHRVIGSHGDLVGYAGGLWRKKWLLEHETKITGTGQSVLF